MLSNETELVGRPVGKELRIILIIVGVIMLASGILGNGLLLVVTWQRRKARDFPNVFIANLALADLVVVCCGLPFYLGDLMVGRYPVVNVLHCRVNAAILCIAYSVSITSLITISFNRYVKVCHNLLFLRIFSPRWNLPICGALWGFGLIANTPAFIPSVDFYGYDGGSHLCNAAGGEARLQYGSMAMISLLVVPVVLIGYFNGAIYKHWSKSRKKMKGNYKKNDPRHGIGLKNNIRVEIETTTSGTGDSGDNTDFTTDGLDGDFERNRNAQELVKESENLGRKNMTDSEPEAIRGATCENTKAAAVYSSDKECSSSGLITLPRILLTWAENQEKKRAQIMENSSSMETSSSSRSRSSSLPIISTEEDLEMIAVLSKGVSSTSLISNDLCGSKGNALKPLHKGRKGSMKLSKKVLLHGSLLRSDFEMGSAAGTTRNMMTEDTTAVDGSTVDSQASPHPNKSDRPRGKPRVAKKKTKAEVALVRSLLVISVSLFILYAPFAINLVLSIFLDDHVPAELPATSTLLLFVNCAINWIIYGVMNTVFRKAYVSALKKMLCCRAKSVNLQ